MDDDWLGLESEATEDAPADDWLGLDTGADDAFPFAQDNWPESTERPVPERNVMESSKDSVVSTMAGFGGLLETAGNIYGLATGDVENFASDWGSRARVSWNELKSPHLKAKEANRKAKIDAADNGWKKAGVAFWETVKDPALMTSLLFEQAPISLIPAGVAGRGTGAAAKALGASTRGAQKAATRASYGTAATMQGSDAGIQAYEQLTAIPQEIWDLDPDYQALGQEVGDKELAKHQMALNLSRQAAIASGLVSLGTMKYIPGGGYLESKVSGATLPGRAVTGKLAKGIIGEPSQEAIEEGGGQWAANFFTSLVDPNQSLTEGVGEAGGVAAAAGLGLGGGAAVVDTAQQKAGRGPYDDLDIDDLFPNRNKPGGGAPGGAADIDVDVGDMDIDAGTSQTPNANQTTRTVAVDGQQVDVETGEIIDRGEYEAQQGAEADAQAMGQGQEIDLTGQTPLPDVDVETGQTMRPLDAPPDMDELPPLSAYEEQQSPQQGLDLEEVTDTTSPVVSPDSVAGQEGVGTPPTGPLESAESPENLPETPSQGQFPGVTGTSAPDKEVRGDISAGVEPAIDLDDALIDAAANEAATSPENDRDDPTEGQKHAGNYKMGHVAVQGLNVTVENPRGSVRKGTDRGGKAWSHEMSDHYGYIKRTEAADSTEAKKQGVDAFIGDNPQSRVAVIIDQIDQETGDFDEHKVMLGYPNRSAAVEAYQRNYDEGWKVGPATVTSVNTLKKWLKEGDTKAPFDPSLRAATADKQASEPQPVETAEETATPEVEEDTAPTPPATEEQGNTEEGESSPFFASYADAQQWVRDEAKRRGMSQGAFRGTDKYKELYPQIRALYEAEHTATAHLRQQELSDAGLQVGDRVRTVHGGLIARAEHTGTIVMRGGTPKVKLDRRMTVTSNGRVRETGEIAWDSRWTKVESEQAQEPPATTDQDQDSGGKSPEKQEAAPPAETETAASQEDTEPEVEPDTTDDKRNKDARALLKKDKRFRSIYDAIGGPDRNSGPFMELYDGYIDAMEGRQPKEYERVSDETRFKGAVSYYMTAYHAVMNADYLAKITENRPARADGMELGPHPWTIRRTPTGSGQPGVNFLLDNVYAAAVEAETSSDEGGEAPAAAGDGLMQLDDEGNITFPEEAQPEATPAPEETDEDRAAREQREAEEAAAQFRRDEEAAREEKRIKGARRKLTRGQAEQIADNWAETFRGQEGYPDDDVDAMREAYFAGFWGTEPPDMRGMTESNPRIKEPIRMGERDILHIADGNEPGPDYVEIPERAIIGGDSEAETDGRSGIQTEPTAGTPAVSGAGLDAEQAGTGADSANLAADQSQDGQAPDSTGNPEGTGRGRRDTDTAGDERPAEGGVRPSVSEGGSREGLDDAGAGGRDGGRDRSPDTVTAPELPPNFHIEDPRTIVGGGPVARFDKNMAAIETYQDILDTGRLPTPEDQATLAGYTGWGSFGQDLFQGTWDNPRPKEGWEKRDEKLRDHLGQSEWESAQRSIINAHYTDPPTVQAMWAMIERAGFKGGRVLEPSLGIGNFFGLMPRELERRSNLAGIELDELTGGMAQLLYPRANISIKGYQDSKTPDDFYDVVLGNWPFYEKGPPDRRYMKVSPTLHDYFFLKAIDQVRPGGLVVGITSKGTMDKIGTGARRAMAKKADLVAAFRLPTGAFKEYAGTGVVTDILVLRKREEPTKLPENTWIDLETYDTPAGEPIKINKYYVEHPDHVLGTLDYGHGTTTGRPGMIVHRPDDLRDRLEAIVNVIDEGIYRERDQVDHISYITNNIEDREGAIVERDDGLFLIRGEYLAPLNEVKKYAVKSAKTTQAREAQLSALVAMRKLYGELIDKERHGEPAEGAREALNAAYQAFNKDHGRLNKSYGLKYMQGVGDPFWASLSALEIKEGENTWRQAPILTEQTIRVPRALENPTIEEAYVLARHEDPEPTLGQIAEAANRPEDEVRDTLIESGAVFALPGGDVVPSDIYLSGNVRQKLREAEAAVADGEPMERNVEVLTEALPPTVPYHEIEAQFGATWIRIEYYKQYVAHMLGLGEDTSKIEVSFRAGRWKVRIPTEYNHRPEASSGYGTEKAKFSRVVNAAITNQLMKITRKDPIEKTTYVDTEATAEANDRVAKIREDFAEWLWSDALRRDDLETEYNEARNSVAIPRFDGSFLRMEGMALQLGDQPFNLRQHQIDAIWRGIVMRRSLNAHEVGTGKTFTMAGIAMESRRYGIAKKPLILAHNANSGTVAHEFLMMYPGAKVLYIDNLSPKTIDIKLRQIANDDWDAVVMPHSLIDRLALSHATLMELAREEIAELEEEAQLAAKDDGVVITDEMWDDPKKLGRLRSQTAKDLVKVRMRIIDTIEKLSMRSSRENAVTFEDLGIDMLLVDEVHEFKKPPIVTQMNLKGLNKSTSDRSIALKFLADYTRGHNGGGNVHTFTGTPITNTLTELYHQMRYIMEDVMADALVDKWDGWFGAFAQELQDVELTPAGEYELVTRLQAFVNVPELRRMVGQYMDTVFSEDMPEMKPRETESGKTLSDPTLTEEERAFLLNGRTEGASDRPYKKVIVDNADMTPAQLDELEKIQRLARSFRNMSGKDKREAMQRGDPESPIIYENLATKASLDERLNDPELVGKEGEAPLHPDSKTARVVNNVLEIYNSDERTTQAIFMQIGIGKSTTRSRRVNDERVSETVRIFSTANDIIERLVAGGIPRDQIALVTGSTSKEKRKRIASEMNTGDKRVVVGNTQTLGVGVNMQRNLRAMHHLDAPWMPGDLEQRNGRGHRQGNQWNTVLEYRYITDRLDGRRWQVLAIKQRFITRFLHSSGMERSIEGEGAADEQSDILETFSEAAGDPRILIREKLKKSIDRVQKKERLHSKAQADALRQMKRLESDIRRLQTEVAQYEAMQEPVAAALENNRGDKFTAVIDGKPYSKRDHANEALRDYIAKTVRSGEDPVPIGTLYGFEAQASLMKYAESVNITLSIPADGETLLLTSSKPSTGSIEHELRSVPKSIEKGRGMIDQARNSIERAKEVAASPFRDAAKLAGLEKEFEELEQDMEKNPVPPPAWLRNGAPVDTEVTWRGQQLVVTGHRWTADNWFVMARDDEGQVPIPYNEVTDEQGMPLYEERPFKPPEVVDDKKQGKPPAEPTAEEEAPRGEDVAREIAIATVGQQPVFYNRTEGPAGGGMPPSKLRLIVNNFLKQYPGLGGVTVEVVRTAGELPDVTDQDAQRYNYTGAYDRRTDTLYLVAGAIANRDEALATIREELLVHKGLGVLKPGQITQVLAGLREAADGSPELKPLWDAVQRDYADHSEQRQAEELLGKIAHERLNPPRRAWNRFVMWFNRLMAKLGFTTLSASKREATELLYRIGDALRSGRRAAARGDETTFQRQEAPARKRAYGLPRETGHPISTFRNTDTLKAHTDYQAAKAGDVDAAERLVRDLITGENYESARKRFGEGVIYAPVHAEEATGRNKIPVMLASAYAAATNGTVGNEIIQANQAFHTGANAMERMVSRPTFAGAVQRGGKYVIVDDVTTMGATLAEMADHIQANGGQVVGTILLANASRTVTMTPSNKRVQELERRYGDEIRQQFGIEPDALTAAEAEYIIGFRSADELRARAATARLENSRRLRAKGVQGESSDQVEHGTSDPDIRFARSAKERGERPKTKAEEIQEAQERKARAAEASGAVMAAELLERQEKDKLTRVQRLWEWLGDLKSGGYHNILAFVPRQYLPDFAHPDMTAVQQFVNLANAMDARRNALQSDHADLVKRWEKEHKRDPEGGRALANLMHQATLAGVDPARDYVPIITPEQAEEQIAVKRERMRGAPGTATNALQREVNDIKRKLRQEAKRQMAEPAIRKLWEALPTWAKETYVEARDAYAAQRSLMLKALQDRIDRSDADEGAKTALMDELRQEFESTAVEEPYFPLTRFGDYWVAVFDEEGDIQDYQMREKQSDQLRFIAAMEAQGYKPVSGRHSKVRDDAGRLNAAFATKIAGMMQQFPGSVADDIADEVWQTYLRLLPELSARKQFIHRKKIPGFQGDALRAYAHNMFHQAHQLAKLEFADRLDNLLDKSSQQARSLEEPADRNKATVLVDAMRDGHQWAMNPLNSAWATKATAFGFAWYLGASIASAGVNLSQTIQIAFPHLGSKYGFDSSIAAIGKAATDLLVNRGAMTEDETRAFDALMDGGVLDKTQAHDLAGIGEQGEKYLGSARKTMEALSFLFHMAEKANREVTALAAYRLAVKKGVDHDSAVLEAANDVWLSHYNYSNANRPKVMRGDIAKVALLFRQYSLNTTYRMVRDFNDGVLARESDPQARRTARRRFIGIQITTLIMAGVPAMWAAWMVFAMATWLMDWDDDEPFDAETEFRAFLVEISNATTADFIMTGVFDTFTPISVSQRISLSDLWWRDSGIEKDAHRAWGDALIEAAGPVPQIFGDAFKGLDLMQEEHYWRGIEKMLPTFMESISKSGRYAIEGVTTYRGDAILPADQIPWGSIASQFAGFTPSDVAKKYNQNYSIMAYQREIQDRRATLLNRYYLAVRMNDLERQAELDEDIREYNRKFPGKAIDNKTIERSMDSRFRYSDKARSGMMIDPGLLFLTEDLDFYGDQAEPGRKMKRLEADDGDFFENNKKAGGE